MREVEICLSFVSQLELTFCKLPFYTLLHAKPCGVIKTKLLGWTEEMTPQLRAPSAVTEAWVQFPALMWWLISTALVSEDLTSSSDLHGHQECMWCVYRHTSRQITYTHLSSWGQYSFGHMTHPADFIGTYLHTFPRLIENESGCVRAS